MKYGTKGHGTALGAIKRKMGLRGKTAPGVLISTMNKMKSAVLSEGSKVVDSFKNGKGFTLQRKDYHYGAGKLGKSNGKK